jgi:antitoxin CcdA
MSEPARSLDLDPKLLDEATSLNVDVPRAAADGVRRAVEQEKSRRWFAENPDYFKSWNDWIEKNGLPLAKYRQF